MRIRKLKFQGLTHWKANECDRDKNKKYEWNRIEKYKIDKTKYRKQQQQITTIETRMHELIEITKTTTNNNNKSNKKCRQDQQKQQQNWNNRKQSSCSSSK